MARSSLSERRARSRPSITRRARGTARSRGGAAGASPASPRPAPAPPPPGTSLGPRSPLPGRGAGGAENTGGPRRRRNITPAIAPSGPPGKGVAAAQPTGRYRAGRRARDPAALPRHSPLPTAAPAPLCARRAPAPPSPAAGRPAPPPRRAGGGGGRSRDPRRRPLPPAGHMQREAAAQAPGGSRRARPAASEASSGVKMATSAAGEGIPGPARSAPRCRLGWARRGGEGTKSGCRCPSALSLCRPLLLRRLRAGQPPPAPQRSRPDPLRSHRPGLAAHRSAGTPALMEASEPKCAGIATALRGGGKQVTKAGVLVVGQGHERGIF